MDSEKLYKMIGELNGLYVFFDKLDKDYIKKELEQIIKGLNEAIKD